LIIDDDSQSDLQAWEGKMQLRRSSGGSRKILRPEEERILILQATVQSTEYFQYYFTYLLRPANQCRTS